ncbi:MAG: hypothetical protein PVJ57_06640 [Phycisphaerae bacterium]|jgi:hypothetical protein
MCPDDDIERALRELPVTTWSAEAETQILEAIHAAGGARPCPWWRRPVPLWQAVAATLVLAALAFWGGGRRASVDAPSPPDAVEQDLPPVRVWVAVDKPLYPPPDTGRLDASRWDVLATR